MTIKTKKSQIIKAYSGVDSRASEVAKSLEVSRQYVYKVWLEAKLPLRPRPVRTAENLRIYRCNYSRKRREASPGYRSRQTQRDKLREFPEPIRRIWCKIRRKASKKGLPFDLELGDIKIPSICPVLGIPLKISDKDLDSCPSIDRIENHRGYTRGNIIIVSHRANRLKSDAFMWELDRISKFYRELKRL
jgi:hypothetical protein